MKIIFFGAPDFAAASLRSLLSSDKHTVCAVVSQPDRPKGRSGKPVPTPVSQMAEDAGIITLKPDNVKDAEPIALLRQFNADIFVVAAYGQFLNKTLLTMPRFGAVNVHASLLPKYRGASPVQMAIVNGEEKTGITIMQMDKGMDTGDILHAEEIPIAGDDTYHTLLDKLAVLGGKALLNAIDKINRGIAIPHPQDNAAATYAPLLTKDMGVIDFNAPPYKIYSLVRGFNPWPGTTAEIYGETFKIWHVQPTDLIHGEQVGTIIPCDNKLQICCGNNGVLDILELQAHGGKRLTAAEFLRGRR
ncbi:MAG: methionyl-tRNA formyltransferase [Defluviitaleaceae bacterium]|nr:methionyl-tRNA formyltransferase [Defluviitaleaceae bacterium]